MILSKMSYILLGSNINPKDNMRLAIDKLQQLLNVTRVSPIYETTPIKNQEADNFLNAVVEFKTTLDPVTLKFQYLRRIENEMGRVRTGDKFKPRVIDLDLILWGDEIFINEEFHITIPDPEITKYAHMAIPLADLVPEMIHPVEKQSMDEIAKPFRLKQKLVKVDL